MPIQDELLRPEAYVAAGVDGAPAGGAGPVSLRETHISWVFLVGGEVFKVKKPVDLGFVDFRSLSRRKEACEAEVKLNARLAPDVYRGVVAVRRGEDGHLHVGGEGPLVDWAVHMVRLDDDHRADVLLGAGRLTRDHVDAVAHRVAAFHAVAPRGAELARFGAPGAVADNVEENFRQTRALVGAYLKADEAEEILRWQTAFVRSHDALFERRMAEGYVRDGHGDLRLEHVYFEPRGPVVIDCVEFSDPYRVGDTCADIAFLSMDLSGHGRVDLAERLLAVYAREAQDHDLYALVDFYASYRAYVRAKVAAIVAADPGLSPERRAASAAEARRLFLLALSSERRPLLRPELVAVGGVIASGKSTIAEQVSRASGAPIVDADRTRKGMLGVAADHPVNDAAWQGAYTPEFSRRVYAEVLRRAERVLASGRSVVLDASFRSREARRAARDLAVRAGVAFRFVECRADAEASKARLAARASAGGGVSDGRAEISGEFAARFEPVDELPADEHVVVDTTRPLGESLALLRSRLGAWPPGFVA